MQWTPWTARSWTGGNCVFRWPDMEDPLIPTPVVAAVEEVAAAVVEEEEGEVGRPGDKVAMDAGAGARDAEGAAGPAAGAALAPGADPATADPGPGPTPDPSPTLPRPRSPRQSPILVPDLDPDPRPSPSPNPNPSPSPGPEAVPQPPKEAPGQDLKASPSPRQRMEEKPRRSRHASNSFQANTSDVQDRNPTQASVSCCKRRSCVADGFCWLAVEVACCSAECSGVSGILQKAPVTTSRMLATLSTLCTMKCFPHVVMDDKCDFH